MQSDLIPLMPHADWCANFNIIHAVGWDLGLSKFRAICSLVNNHKFKSNVLAKVSEKYNRDFNEIINNTNTDLLAINATVFQNNK